MFERSNWKRERKRVRERQADSETELGRDSERNLDMRVEVKITKVLKGWKIKDWKFYISVDYEVYCKVEGEWLVKFDN